MVKKRVVWTRMDDIAEDMSRRKDRTTHHRKMSPEPREPPVTQAVLAGGQVKRLRAVLDDVIEIHGRGNFPTISVRLVDIVNRLREKLTESCTPCCTKLNGGAASFVASSHDFSFADVDLIFPMSEGDEDSFEKVRAAVFDTIESLMPDFGFLAKFTFENLKDAYIRKMVKVATEDDRWSLFSLNNDYGRCLELKFVNKMRRQFEFSVDSFQICLDPILDNFDSPEEPEIIIESVFGDIKEAMNHLHSRLIDTTKPHEIRGGGLLKYCHLLIRGYKAARPTKCRQLEKYMCSRFFIDFPNTVTQEQKLKGYLESHFGSGASSACSGYEQWSDTDSEASTSHGTVMSASSGASSSILATNQLKYDFLMLLHRVINESTVCLMSHERRMTLAMIDRLAFQISMGQYTNDGRNGTYFNGYTPRTSLFYLPSNSSDWVPVI